MVHPDTVQVGELLFWVDRVYSCSPLRKQADHFRHDWALAVRWVAKHDQANSHRSYTSLVRWIT
jgi:hypothetical protein